MPGGQTEFKTRRGWRAGVGGQVLVDDAKTEGHETERERQEYSSGI